MAQRSFLYGSATVASLAGFLFGFDTVVISEAEFTIQKPWDLNCTMHRIAINMALWRTIVGGLTFELLPEYFITTNSISICW